MKKLQKLTLKELENSAMVIEDQSSVVAGCSSTDGAGGPDISRFGSTNMLPEVTCVGISTSTAYNASGYTVAAPNTETIGGLTPEQQYANACAEGYTQAAKAIAYAGVVLAYSALDVWCILTGKGPSQGQSIISPDQNGGGINSTSPVYYSK